MATSKLQRAVGDLLDKTFPQFTIRENYRPDWLLSSNLTRLELDFYIEEIKAALEIQGRQHYEYTPFFHKDRSDFEQRKQYDIEKKDLCYGAGVLLIEIFTLMDAMIEIKTIDEKFGTRRIKRLAPPAQPEEYTRPPKEQKAKKPKVITQEDIWVMYQKDQAAQLGLGDPEATIEQKIVEIEKFTRKVNKIRKKKGETFTQYFQFKYLSVIEQQVLLEGGKVIMELPPEMIEAKEANQLDDLRRWQKKAIKKVRLGKLSECMFSSQNIPPTVSWNISSKLRTAKTEDEIKTIFGDYFLKHPHHDEISPDRTDDDARTDARRVKEMVG